MGGGRGKGLQRVLIQQTVQNYVGTLYSVHKSIIEMRLKTLHLTGPKGGQTRGSPLLVVHTMEIPLMYAGFCLGFLEWWLEIDHTLFS